MPDPTGDQLVPSHRTTPPPPPTRGLKPATRSPFGSGTSALTRPSIPEPSGDHAPPLQRATWLAPTVPATVKSPPATRSPFASVAKARTAPPNPGASDDQPAPSQ